MCPFFCVRKSELMDHLIRRHKNEKNFIIHCSKSGCGASFTKILSFKRHHYRKHANEAEEDEDEINDHEDLPLNEIEQSVISETQQAEAQFLLKLKSEHNLSEKAIDDIMETTKQMIQHQSSKIKERLSTEIPEHIFETLNDDEIFGNDTFVGLETEFLREKFFEKNLGYIKPQAVKLGVENVLKKVGKKYRLVEKEKLGYIVPFFPQLQELLKMPEVHEELTEENHNLFDIMDVKDGTYYKKKYFQDHKDALLFCLYYDDFEIVNPIGSHRKKHKLSIFYWSLLNISPAFRFKIQTTQLLGVANSSDIRKFGLSAMLKDFVDSMKEIHRGKELNVNNVVKTYYGTLYYVIGDTPATQLLGGFKEGVSMAKKPCRTCNITIDELGNHLSDKKLNFRNEVEYHDRCDALDHLEGISKMTRTFWSKEYGITRRSVLASIPDFDITKCILHDPMHVLLEGIVKVQLQLTLTYFIDKKQYFSLHYLNDRIKTFPYSKQESLDKPQVLEKKAIYRPNNFPMSSIETRNFFILLPLMIGDVMEENVDDEIWKNYIRLLRITLLITSPYASIETIETLEQVIYSYLYNFMKLHPEVPMFPKLHYLVHLPRQILQFGPGRSHMCTRLEGKHGLFKNKKWRNFKSLSLSVALHHQRWMCLRQCGFGSEKSHVYMYGGDEVSYGCEIYTQELSMSVREELEQVQENGIVPDTVLRAANVKICGISYESGNILLRDYSDLDGPEMCIIKDIFVANNIKYFE